MSRRATSSSNRKPSPPAGPVVPLDFLSPYLAPGCGILVLDAKRRIRSAIATPESWRIRLDSLVGETWDDSIDPAERTVWRKLLSGLAVQAVSGRTPATLRRNDGDVVPTFATAMRASDAEIWIALERKEPTPLASPDEEREFDAVRHWAGVFAHEMNQPLTAVLTTAQACRSLLSAGEAPVAEMIAGMESLVRRVQNAAEVVRRLRSMATGEPPRRVRVDLRNLIRDAVETARAAIEGVRATVRYEFPDPLPVVSADAVQIGQVVANLVRNAVEAMSEVPATRRRLTIGVRVDEESREAIVWFEDRGVGLSVEQVRGLFRPVESTKPAGMGLGLAVCRRIVESQGGRIWVAANSTRGCTFSFSLPLDE